MLRKGTIITVAMFGLMRPALAGPPYVSDDPEPTDYKHFEIYTFGNGTATKGDIGGATGVDFNYGAAPDLQLTATLPAGFDRPAAAGTSFGLSNIELAAKYRFLHQDSFGLDVSVFPRVFLPSPSKNIGNDTASLLLPVWVQKDWSGGWSAFGGGGCVISGRSSQNFCLAGGVVTYQLLPKLQLGVELFHQTADGSGTPAASSVGLGARYDLNDTYHLLGYVRRGIQNATETDQFSCTLPSSLHFECSATADTPIRVRHLADVDVSSNFRIAKVDWAVCFLGQAKPLSEAGISACDVPAWPVRAE